MKKLITIVLLAALAVPVAAQELVFTDEQTQPQELTLPQPKEQKWTVRGSVGFFPTVPVMIDIFGGMFVGIAVGLNKDANETLDFDLPPYFALEGMYSFNESWSVGLGTGYLGTTFKVVDKDTREVKSSSVISIFPLTAIGRYNYLNRPAVKLYGSLELGGMFMFQDELQVVPDVQLNPIGVEFGRRFFGMVELGIGMNYTGLKGGIGYRF